MSRLLGVVRTPLVLFLAIGLTALVAIVVGTTVLSRRAAAAEAVADARNTTLVLARSVAEPALPAGLVDLEAGAIDRFDRSVLDRVIVPTVRRVKIWRADGTIVYSDEVRLIGSRYPLDEDEIEILDTRGVEAEVSDLSKPENRYERRFGGLLEVYTRVESPEGEPLLFEVYFAADAIEARRADIAAEFRPITLGALGMVVLVATALLYGLTRRLQLAAQDRERLLLAAVDASEAERGRIARDLHDGVVQDITGAAYTVFALARDDRVPSPVRRRLTSVASSLRASQGALRSLMVEIYPPDLEAATLAASLQDLLAPAEAQGITASAEVRGLESVGPQTVRLLWRTAQEAVRNTLRHSGASALRVEVVGDPGRDRVRLEVVDDGHGFRRADVGPTRFGLRGLEGLAADAGGRLEVDSEPDRGTTVRLLLEEAHR